MNFKANIPTSEAVVAEKKFRFRFHIKKRLLDKSSTILGHLETKSNKKNLVHHSTNASENGGILI